jgi:hypothetical protein
LTLLFPSNRPAVMLVLRLSDFDQNDEVECIFDNLESADADANNDAAQQAIDAANNQRRRSIRSGSLVLFSEYSELEDGRFGVVSMMRGQDSFCKLCVC